MAGVQKSLTPVKVSLKIAITVVEKDGCQGHAKKNVVMITDNVRRIKDDEQDKYSNINKYDFGIAIYTGVFSTSSK